MNQYNGRGFLTAMLSPFGHFFKCNSMTFNRICSQRMNQLSATDHKMSRNFSLIWWGLWIFLLRNYVMLMDGMLNWKCQEQVAVELANSLPLTFPVHVFFLACHSSVLSSFWPFSPEKVIYDCQEWKPGHDESFMMSAHLSFAPIWFYLKMHFKKYKNK